MSTRGPYFGDDDNVFVPRDAALERAAAPDLPGRGITQVCRANPLACASVLSPEPHRSELADPGWSVKEPCGDFGGASAQLALNLLCIVTAVVATLSLQRAFFRAPASP